MWNDFTPWRNNSCPWLSQFACDESSSTFIINARSVSCLSNVVARPFLKRLLKFWATCAWKHSTLSSYNIASFWVFIESINKYESIQSYRLMVCLGEPYNPSSYTNTFNSSRKTSSVPCWQLDSMVTWHLRHTRSLILVPNNNSWQLTKFSCFIFIWY